MCFVTPPLHTYATLDSRLRMQIIRSDRVYLFTNVFLHGLCVSFLVYISSSFSSFLSARCKLLLANCVFYCAEIGNIRNVNKCRTPVYGARDKKEKNTGICRSYVRISVCGTSTVWCFNKHSRPYDLMLSGAVSRASLLIPFSRYIFFCLFSTCLMQ